MQKQYFLASLAIIGACACGAAYAQNIGNEQIPKTVSDNFYKKFSDATDVQVESVTHFGAPLFKFAFQRNKEAEISYFRPNGSFFVNGFVVDEDEIPLEAQKNLKTEFSDYRVTATSLIVNPNGAGREYEVDIKAAGGNWEFITDESGAILSKTQE